MVNDEVEKGLQEWRKAAEKFLQNVKVASQSITADKKDQWTILTNCLCRDAELWPNTELANFLAEKSIRSLYHKTYYGHNLQISVISWSVCPCQAFPAYLMFAGKARSLP